MDENISFDGEQLESVENRDMAELALDDATHEPGTYIESSGDFEQSEAIQNGLTTLVDVETIDTSQLEYDPGPVEQPPDLDHGYGPYEVESEDDDSVLGRTPQVQGDTSSLKPAESEESDDRLEATPATLPAPLTTISDDEVINELQTNMREDQDEITNKNLSPDNLMDVGELEQSDDNERNLDSSLENASQEIGEEPKQANFEKPILKENMENDGMDAGIMDDPGSVGPGSNPGIQGNTQGPGWDGFGNKSGDYSDGLGFTSGPDDLSSDPFGEGEGYNIPGVGPFKPGKGPDAHTEMTSGGSKKTPPTTTSGSMKTPPTTGSGSKKTPPATGSGSKKVPPPSGSDKSPYDDAGKNGENLVGYTLAGTVRDTFWVENKKTGAFQVYHNPNAAKYFNDLFPGRDSLDEEADSKFEKPAGLELHNGPNQKYNPGLISNEDADDAGSNTAPDGILPKYQQMMKDIIRKTREVVPKTRVKVGSELITDPPEHEPDTKSKSGDIGNEG